MKIVKWILGFTGRRYPRVAAFLLSRIWFRTLRPRPHRDREDWLRLSKKDDVVFRNRVITVYSRTVSNPRGRVVLLHGWSGRWDQMLPLASALQQANFDVVSFDFPSHGENPGRETNLFELRDFLNLVDQKLNLADAIIISHSMAFLVVATAVLKYGFQFNKLVTIGSPGRFEYLLESSRDKLGWPESVDPSLWRMIEKRVKVRDVASQVATSHMAHFEASRVFIVHDENDKEVSFSEAERMTRLWPEARHLWTSGLGHNRILRDAKVIREVVAFLRN